MVSFALAGACTQNEKGFFSCIRQMLMKTCGDFLCMSSHGLGGGFPLQDVLKVTIPSSLQGGLPLGCGSISRP
jgi:hypothetical protein